MPKEKPPLYNKKTPRKTWYQSQSTSTGPNSWTKKLRKKERNNCINKGKGKVKGKRIFPLLTWPWPWPWPSPYPDSSVLAREHPSDGEGVVVVIGI